MENKDKPLSEKALETRGQIIKPLTKLYIHKDVKEAVENWERDNELSIKEIKERLKRSPDNEFLIGKIQGIRTAEDKHDKIFGEFK